MTGRGEVRIEVDGMSARDLGQMLLVLDHHFPAATVSTLGTVLGTITVKLGGELVAGGCWHGADPATAVAVSGAEPGADSYAGRSFTDEEKQWMVSVADRTGIGAASEELGIHQAVLRAWRDDQTGLSDDDRVGTPADVEDRTTPTPLMSVVKHPAGGMVSSGVHHPVDHDAARARAFPRDDGA